MLYHLLTPFADDFGAFNLFRYITFRSAGALMTALFLSFFVGKPIINWLRSMQKLGQPIRSDGPESHQSKKGTPTMGGLIILLTFGVSTLLWSDLSNGFVWLVLLTTLAFGAVGGADDYLKLKRRTHRGLTAAQKMGLQLLIGALTTLTLLHLYNLHDEALKTSLTIPFFKGLLFDLGWFYLVFGMVVVVGASNAVNLTDGLDGLAIGATIFATLAFMIITYLAGNLVFANYLQIHHIRGGGELAVLCAALIGAGLGFLWYNACPAEVFMGDTGSLAIGALLGTVSLITKHELVLAIVGGLFVVETLSVMIQVSYFRYSGGKRVFLMAPLHHHFEKKGWPESKVVIRFWIVSLVLALIGLSTLKVR
jgi:phospho-N-acetylmuramoyl-pentapeptide-transferase